MSKDIKLFLKDQNLVNAFQLRNQEGEDRFHEAKLRADELDTLSEKITFWAEEKAKYLHSLKGYDLGVSGHVGQRFATNGELWFDRLVSIEIEKLKTQLDATKDFNDSLEPLPDEIKSQIAWLYAIGVIDYIEQQLTSTGGFSDNAIASVLRVGMGYDIKTNTISGYVRKIKRDEQEWLKYKGEIEDRCRRLKMPKVK
jgi:hypothetical protein